MGRREHLGLVAALVVAAMGASVRGQEMVKAGAEPVVAGLDPATLKYDYLVDGTLERDDPAGRKFKTLQAAYAAAPEGTEARPTVIGIKPNVYQIAGSMERAPSLSIRKNWITLLGLTNNRRTVVLADNRGLAEGASDDGYLLDVNATGFTAKNLTIINYCNCDYEYPGDASKNLKKRNPTITQAVALQAAGDKHVYENVALLSRLDTMFLRTTRSYFKNVYIEGTDDWMGGGQMSVWQDCTLVYPTGRGVMSASGVVFFNCRFEATRGMQFYKAEYGGAARPDALIDCVVPVSSPEAPVAWVRGVAAPRPNQLSLTYRNKVASGKPAVIEDDSVGGPAFTYSRELSEEELRAYNPWNLLRAAPNMPADNWDPAGVREKYEGQGPQVYRMTLSGGSGGRSGRAGGAGGGAAMVGAGGNVSVAWPIRTGGPGVTIGAAVVPGDVADKSIRWSTDSELVSLSATTGAEVVVTARNGTEKSQYVPIVAKASNGFYVTAYVYVQPKLIAAPVLTSGPKIGAPAAGKVAVEYGIDLGGREDESEITWYACDDAAGANPVKVAVSRGDVPLKSYTLMPGDVGKFLRVSVEPKHAMSEAGPAVHAMAGAAVRAADVPSTTVSANFRNFVETPTGALVNGRWNVVGNWSVVEGETLANGYGIRAAAATGRGAAAGPSALFYMKEGEAGDMQVDLEIRPEKTEGTVFNVPGSPSETGSRNSHGDIYIKYDPRTKNGYSLRYWRTTQSAAACVYQFYKIENGVGSPLNDQQVLSGVFKQNTLLTLKVSGKAISVRAHNTFDGQTLEMEGTIAPNRFSGAGVSATGAVTTYSAMKVSYP
ncbi:MAG TPA: pectinesterase family protein [Phycisphaerae bacterium]|nr:pectinesterase family protein [Phycisphaerae bacterium]